MIRITCKCGKNLGVGDDFAGKKVRCPACMNVLAVPAGLDKTSPVAPGPITTPAPVNVPTKPAPAAAGPDIIRVTCKCGKSLGLGGIFAGKEVRCPACASMVQVPGPRTPGSAEPPLPAQTPAMPMAEPVLAAPVAAPVAQPPKKSHVLLFAVLGSGGLAALLLLAGVVWAAWAIFGGGSTDTAAGTTNKVTTTNKITSGNAKTDSGPSSKDDKSAPPQPVPVKLFAPFKKGDRREVKLVAEVKEETQFEEIDKLPPDLAGALAKDPSLRVATLHGVIRTLEVNEQGGETKIEFTVDHFETRQEGGFQPGQSEPPVPKGTVIIGTLRDKGFQWSTPGGEKPPLAAKLLDFLPGGLLNLHDTRIDQILGTVEKQPIGGTWEVNKEMLASHITRLKGEPPPGEKAPEITASGQGKLVNIASEDGKEILEVDITLDVAYQDGPMSLVARNTVSVRMPREGFKGPTKQVDKMDHSYQGKIDLGNPGQPTMVLLKQKNVITATSHITYLENIPIPDAPDAEPLPVPVVRHIEVRQQISLSLSAARPLQ